MVHLQYYSVAVSLLLPSWVAAQNCTLQFDGRVPSDLVAADFDSPNKFFSEKFVLGQGLKFDQALRVLPVAGGSLVRSAHPNDSSIFNSQVGFRRAELIPASNDGTDPSTQGVKTLHFSVKKDAARPLNLSHEYQLVFLESNDFSTNQFVLKTGTILGQNTADPDTLQVFGNVNQGQLLFSTPFVDGVFHNFALKLDFDQSTTQVFFSAGEDPLKAVTDVLKNDLSGQGQFHFGVLKKPVGGQGDITKNGFQEAGINEGIIFGGIFEEDSADGCITLAGQKA
ncbi:uncharacterized protein THITE_2142658 [Thermothielavioides terrestris NRRL 8126]|uniref:Glycoside hydrolase 131 catalytic N-terminal domain-containing protein n=1 Tax=Thermothielavioides terrestris (strain ATCC 38088 / NRRL 8126) TaxID=578455 RepID=G2R1D7_THETT|nr:uncharacterized protein THITE_2142658 [Thermothielavioides terrestris NRRL 8126]AEO64872.1 hypothetical protein THITE_2142658 [Thermothielavioides terrestris NRRL 8126]